MDELKNPQAEERRAAPPARFCPHCGAPLSDTARFCARCGQFCAEAARPQLVQAALKPARKSVNKRAVLAGFAAVAVVAVALAIILLKPFARPAGNYYLIDAFEGWNYVARSQEAFSDEDIERAGALSAYRDEAELTAWFADREVDGSARYLSYRLALLALDGGEQDVLLVPNEDVDELYRGGWSFEWDYLVALEDTAVDTAARRAMDKRAADPIHLSDLEKIRALDLDGARVESLDDVGLMRGLVQLTAQDCGLRDLTPLARCAELESLNLAENEIEDIAPLAGLTRLEEVDLSENEVEDFSCAAQWRALKRLDVAGNPADGALLSQAVREFDDEVVGRTVETAFEPELPHLEYAAESICGIQTGYEFYTGENDGQYAAPRLSEESLTIHVGETATLSLTAYSDSGWSYYVFYMADIDAADFYDYVEIDWGVSTSGEGYGITRLEITGKQPGDTAILTYFSNESQTRASSLSRVEIHVVA